MENLFLWVMSGLAADVELRLIMLRELQRQKPPHAPLLWIRNRMRRLRYRLGHPLTPAKAFPWQEAYRTSQPGHKLR